MTAKVYATAGRSLAILEDWRRAQTAFEASVRHNPYDATVWRALARAYRSAGPQGPVVHHRLGLVLGNQGDPTAAIRACDAATSLDPDDPDCWIAAGDAYRAAGDHESSRAAYARATELDPNLSDAWFFLGRATASIAHRNGGFTADQLDEVHASWTTSIDTSAPHDHVNARFHLVRSTAQFGRWDRSLALAWPDIPSQIGTGTESLVRLLDAPPPDAPRDWWFAAAWRLQHDGQFVSADRARLQMARTVADVAAPIHDVGGLVDWLKAAALLGRHDEARHVIATLRLRTYLPDDAAALRKIDADLALGMGDTAPYCEWHDRNADALDPIAETRFSTLVTGRDVAIVGPADVGLDSGEEIERHDTVIRMKFVDDIAPQNVARFGTRTDVGYYADSSAAVLRAHIASAIENDRLSMAVFRPTTFHLEHRWFSRPGDLRVLPNEDSTTFHASRFAVHRIVYDLLRYRPRSIKIFNANFFAATNPYMDGYLFDVDDVYVARQLVRVVPMFGHDIGGDFRFLQRLIRADLISGDQIVTELLDLDVADYLRRLERHGVLGATALRTGP